MRRLLAFYDHEKDKAKIRYGHSAFQEPAGLSSEHKIDTLNSP